jgi:hypothetical protein
MDQEGMAILERLEKHSGPVVVLDRLGKAINSMELAA